MSSSQAPRLCQASSLQVTVSIYEPLEVPDLIFWLLLQGDRVAQLAGMMAAVGRGPAVAKLYTVARLQPLQVRGP